MKYVIFAAAVLLVLGATYYYFSSSNNNVYEAPNTTETTPNNEAPAVTEPMDTPTAETPTRQPREVIGSSAAGNDIVAYHFGDGDTELLFVGGIHGGYSANTSLVAFEMISHLEANPDLVPENVTVTVIPVMNPDGLERVTGTVDRFDASDIARDTATQITGRFNDNEVDLNRNFDCQWKAEGTWQNRTVSGGSAPFSEPEAKAVADYVTQTKPAAAVVWYSAAGGVYASSCNNGVLPATNSLMETYANASGYPSYAEFDYYEITGDMVNWLAKERIPAVSVLLTNHVDVEWNKNRAGIEAVIASFQN